MPSIRTLFATWFMLVSCLAYYSVLKMEAVISFETLVKFSRNIRRHTTKDILLLVIRVLQI
jgi:hypothetical protein